MEDLAVKQSDGGQSANPSIPRMPYRTPSWLGFPTPTLFDTPFSELPQIQGFPPMSLFSEAFLKQTGSMTVLMVPVPVQSLNTVPKEPQTDMCSC